MRCGYNTLERPWRHLLGAMDFLETHGLKWEANDHGFDCHGSYVVRWFVPEGLMGHLI